MTSRSGLFRPVLLSAILSFYPAPNESSAAGEPGDAGNPYLEAYNQLSGLKPDCSRTADAAGLVIRRDAAVFTLNRGRIVLLSPVRGRPSAFIFRGDGRVTFDPPLPSEREQLARYFKEPRLDRGFESLFVVFNDTTWTELTRKAPFVPGKPDPDDDRIVQGGLNFIRVGKEKYIDPGIIGSFLRDDPNGLFYAQFNEDAFHPLFFEIDPDQTEKVVLMQEDASTGLVSHGERETVCRFPGRDDPPAGRDTGRELERIRIKRYRIETTIRYNMEFESAATMELVPLRDGESWLRLDLYPKLKVDSVVWEDGRKAAFFKGDENPDVWIRCDPPLSAGRPRSLTVHHRGTILDRDDYFVYLKSSTGWYPAAGDLSPAFFDLVFHTPRQYRFASIGECVSSSEEADSRTTRWVTKTPVLHASFNLGFFKEHAIEDARVPPVTVWMVPEAHRDVAQYLIQAGITSGRSMEKSVGADVANSLSFFGEMFGKTPIPRFFATEIPYSHGQAFPGMIHLSFDTFQKDDPYGANELFRAHEVAHQWWGLGVGWRTYHDQWLSEGFAEFSGLWYVQATKGNESYFATLKDWRNAILTNRRSLFGNGQEAGPIWLGQRTSTSRTRGDYDLIIYKKSAWVLHMLRNMMIDLKTMNEDRFKGMMKDFYGRCEGKQAVTGDFKGIAEEYAGIPLDWFFDQWVYGSDIPEYDFSYRVVETPDGRYNARCRIRQSQVPDDFRMFVPITVDFGDNRIARLRYMVTGKEMEFNLPPLPEKPRKIVFNDLESVLCKVNEVKWKDD
jgi:hypothetical protein